jgi:hypothetical protein
MVNAKRGVSITELGEAVAVLGDCGDTVYFVGEWSPGKSWSLCCERHRTKSENKSLHLACARLRDLCEESRER